MTDTKDKKAELAAIHTRRKAEGRKNREVRRIYHSRKADDSLLEATKTLGPLLDYRNGLRDQLQDTADDIDNVIVAYLGRSTNNPDAYFEKMMVRSQRVLSGRARGGHAKIVPTDQLGYTSNRVWVDEDGQLVTETNYELP